jgi:phosphatidylserine/phosphatidylglycerophosphate/cardiolipin synthase-like enzyme
MIAVMKALVLLLLFCSFAFASPEVCFTPGEDCTGVIVREVGTAKKSVRVLAYSFTSAPIAKALVDASKRGVHVEVILDRSNRTERYSGLTFLVHADIPTSVDSKHAIAHNKVIVIDDETVITGSFNFTKAAQEHNAENLIVIHDAALAAKYVANWKVHLAHSDDVTP